MIRLNLIIGTLIIVLGVVSHLLLIHPMDTAMFHGEEVEIYSISALLGSFLLKCLVVYGLYYYLKAAALKCPDVIGKGRLLYKVAIAFLFLLFFLNVTELALKGIFTEEVLGMRIEDYENPDVLPN